MEQKYFLTWANARLKTACGRTQARKALRCHSRKGLRASPDTHGQAAGKKRVFERSTKKELAELRSKKGKDGVGNHKEKAEKEDPCKD